MKIATALFLVLLCVFPSGCSNNSSNSISNNTASADIAPADGKSKKNDALKHFAINSLFGSIVGTANNIESNKQLSSSIKR